MDSYKTKSLYIIILQVHSSYDTSNLIIYVKDTEYSAKINISKLTKAYPQLNDMLGSVIKLTKFHHRCAI